MSMTDRAHLLLSERLMSLNTLRVDLGWMRRATTRYARRMNLAIVNVSRSRRDPPGVSIG